MTNTFASALTALIDQRHAAAQRLHELLPETLGTLETRDEIAAGNENVRISSSVFGEAGLLDEFYREQELLDFGTFDNCREHGITVSVGGWTFAAYEHRNSDDICINGCPTADVQPYGPYGGEDKHDVLFSCGWKQYHEAADALKAFARAVIADPAIGRAELSALVARKGVTA